jgi:hypothetical protein
MAGWSDDWSETPAGRDPRQISVEEWKSMPPAERLRIVQEWGKYPETTIQVVVQPVRKPATEE